MKMNRREFISAATMASATFVAPNIICAADKPKYIWANLIHLGYNMWNDHVNTPEHPALDKDGKPRHVTFGISDRLRCDDKTWVELTTRTRDIGMNMLVIDLAEGIVYPSHPELAVKGSWSVDRLRKELERLRKMGLEPIPKLNFSTTHDAWLKEYSKMVSSAPYYRVCADLIKDVCELFGHPRFVHIGMDEENAVLQKEFVYAVSRNEQNWYDDVNFYVREVERNGARAWMWGDAAWSNPEFIRNIPTRVVQSNWYYWKDVAEIEKKALEPMPKGEKRPDWAGQNHVSELRCFLEFDRAGYDQIPGATNWNNPENMGLVADYCIRNISPERLKGFFFMPWQAVLPVEKCMKRHNEYFKEAEKVIKRFG